jgi:hypothetical protein
MNDGKPKSLEWLIKRYHEEDNPVRKWTLRECVGHRCEREIKAWQEMGVFCLLKRHYPKSDEARRAVSARQGAVLIYKGICEDVGFTLN